MGIHFSSQIKLFLFATNVLGQHFNIDSDFNDFVSLCSLEPFSISGHLSDSGGGRVLHHLHKVRLWLRPFAVIQRSSVQVLFVVSHFVSAPANRCDSEHLHVGRDESEGGKVQT